MHAERKALLSDLNASENDPTSGSREKGTGIAKKMVFGLSVLALFAVVIAIVGVYFINKIESSLNQITDYAAPTVETADDLVMNIWEAAKVAEEIIADEELEDIRVLREEFNQFEIEFKKSYEELDALVDDRDLLDELDSAKQRHEAFIRNANIMIEAHIAELEEEINADRLLEAFDGVGAKLIAMLDEFADENEAEMAKVEGDVLVQRGLATASDINDLMGSLFNQDYPVVEASLKLQRLIIEMQDTAGEYMATEHLGHIEKPAREFAGLAAAAKPHFDVINRLAETEEDRQDAKVLQGTFDLWVSQASQDEQLFDTHRDMLANETAADEATEAMESDADSMADTLDVVVEKADALSDGADEIAAGMVSRAQTIMAVLVGAAIMVGVALLLMVVKTVTQPIVQMTTAMKGLANGDLQSDIPAQGRSDEVGAMARAVQIFKENAIKARDLESEREALARKAEQEKRALMNRLASEFEGDVGGVVEAVSSSATEMQQTAKSMNEIAEQTERQAQTVAAASEQSSVNVQTVAASAEELSRSITNIRHQVAESNDVAARASAKATETHETVQGLVTASQEISEVVALITDIAEQTNLLALNATIEAARAGDMGKGFAVVASEVKNLANQTARATEEISQKIDEVQSATNRSAKAIEEINAIAEQVNRISTGIAGAVEEQSAATREIARNVEEAASGTTEVSQNIAEVMSAAGRAGTTAARTTESANALSREAALLAEKVRDFLGKIRA